MQGFNHFVAKTRFMAKNWDRWRWRLKCLFTVQFLWCSNDDWGSFTDEYFIMVDFRGKISKSKNDILGVYKGKFWIFVMRPHWEINPSWNTTCGTRTTVILPNMFSLVLGKKSETKKWKKKFKKKLWTWYLTPSCAGETLLGRFFKNFLACGVIPRTKSTVPKFKSFAPGVRELGGLKSGVSHRLSSSPLQQCYTLPCYAGTARHS